MKEKFPEVQPEGYAKFNVCYIIDTFEIPRMHLTYRKYSITIVKYKSILREKYVHLTDMRQELNKD